jgi:hypothetical protein
MPQIHAKADNITLTVAAQPDGKLRATGLMWDDAFIFMPNEVLELRGVERQGARRSARQNFRPPCAAVTRNHLVHSARVGQSGARRLTLRSVLAVLFGRQPDHDHFAGRDPKA